MASASSRLGSSVLLVAVILVAACGAAAGATSSIIVSPNWAGYVATPAADASVAFTTVTGTWRQPKSVCTGHDVGAAAVIWIGLGGFDGSTQELEQIGSSAGCDRRGQPSSGAWFDLFPYPEHAIPHTVRPGDMLTATVTVLSTAVRLELVDHSRSWAVTRTIAGLADTSSAEWIVEAPLTCVRHTCRQAPLANFGSVMFTRVSAGTDAYAGALTTPAWAVSPIQLTPGPPKVFKIGGKPGSETGTPLPPGQAASSSAAAVPGPMTADGTRFTVTWYPEAPSRLLAGGRTAASECAHGCANRSKWFSLTAR